MRQGKSQDGGNTIEDVHHVEEPVQIKEGDRQVFDYFDK